ncbi:MAG TPA: ABC transporter ATP-binding protein [Candidatus Binatia bacterium]|nr:ABC transporter ATP-binding protein [Candidatus Binatia bacterium]
MTASAPPAAASRAAGGDPAIRISDVGKSYLEHPVTPRDWAIRHISLEVHRGEFFVLLGPSGCGKSTLLRLIAGIAEVTEGSVMTDEGPVTGPSSRRGMVFQSLETPLFDWLTVRQNAEFGLRMAGVPSRERRETVDGYLALVGLRDHDRKYPHELSGGMKQRLQIARALATDPAMLLMDEPFASVDAQTRRLLQTEVQRVWAETGKTVVYVTHDIREALLLGQRIVVMTSGPAASIGEIFVNDAPYPRDDLAEGFAVMFRRVEDRIVQEVNKGRGEGAA